MEALRIEMEGTNPSTSNGNHGNGHGTATEWSTASPDSASALVLYGTVTGNAELLAHKLADELRAGGMIAYVRDMARCQANILTQADFVLMVVSTYGDGEPPEDALRFWQAVVHGKKLDLSGLRYSVLALGNTTYDRFCQCGRDFDTALERHGATRIYPRVDCDVDYDARAKRWFAGVLSNLRRADHATLSG
jgi:sulfite reductase (NADPH) flavoprotein alpha-component